MLRVSLQFKRPRIRLSNGRSSRKSFLCRVFAAQLKLVESENVQLFYYIYFILYKRPAQRYASHKILFLYIHHEFYIWISLNLLNND